MPPRAFDPTQVRLVERLTYGATEADLRRVAELGFSGYLQEQLQLGRHEDSEFESDVRRRFPRLTWDPHRLQALGYNNESGDQLISATLYRRLKSRRQLYERVVEMWSDHFNIALQKVGPALLIAHDRDIIRKYALTTFPDLLKATAKSPAMLAYLDNDQSNALRPCQNYARELLELHTVGVGMYGQKDVREVARCLTGWTYERAEERADFGAFRFDPSRHDDRDKTVMGRPIPAGSGVRQGEQLLDYLAFHPETMRRVAHRICAWLISEDPPVDAVTAVAAAYATTGGDISKMIETAAGHPSFATSSRSYKRPAHLFLSSLRAMEVRVDHFLDIRYGYLRQLEHTPFEWPLPNGFPVGVRAWADQMLPRWNFGLALLNNGIGGLTLDFDRIFPPPYTPVHVVDRIEAVLFPAGLPKEDRKELIQFLRKVDYLDATRSRAAVALAMGLNAFQWS